MKRKMSKDEKIRNVESNHLFRKVKHRLILIYTIITATILVGVVTAIFVINFLQRYEKMKSTFKYEVQMIANQFQISSKVNNSWLSNLETKYHMLIHLEVNGTALHSHGSWKAEDERTAIFERVKEMALDEGLDLSAYPVSYGTTQYRYYTYQGEDGEKYLVSAVVIPMEKNYRTMIVLQCFPEDVHTFVVQLLIYICLTLCGIIGIYMVNRHFVKKTMKPVEESKKQQSEFIACASHELKSPIAVIHSSAEAITASPEDTQHFVNNIESESVRMARLIDDLLLLSSTEAGYQCVKRDLVELDTILIQTYDTYYKLCKNANIELNLSLPETVLEPIYGDEGRLMQVLGILIDNAIHYSETTDIQLSLSMDKHNYLVKVIDHGIGIDKAVKDKIFDKFYRVDKSHHDKTHYGLGLSIASDLVHLHNGRIILEDTKGGGCTFVIKLPRDH